MFRVHAASIRCGTRCVRSASGGRAQHAKGNPKVSERYFAARGGSRGSNGDTARIANLRAKVFPAPTDVKVSAISAPSTAKRPLLGRDKLRARPPNNRASRPATRLQRWTSRTGLGKESRGTYGPLVRGIKIAITAGRRSHGSKLLKIPQL